MIDQPPIRVRPATVEDAERIAALVQAAYRSDESRLGWTSEAHLVGGQRADAAMVRDLVRGPDSVVLVGTTADPTGGDADGCDGGGLLACCHLERRPTTAYLGMFAVQPGRQGRGVGRTMLRAAEEHARDTWGLPRLEITVLNHRPELIAWYERCGFEMTGQEHAFPYGDERFGVPHRSDLVLLGMVRDLTLSPVGQGGERLDG